MAGVKITYQVVKEQALKALTGLDLRTRDLTPVMQDFAGYMKGSVQKNFDAQGRPARWAPLKPASMASWLASRRSWVTKRKKKGGSGFEDYWGGKMVTGAGLKALHGRLILTDTARLRNSINFQALARGVEGFTNVKYGAIHHLGGTTKAHTIVPRVKKALFWPGAGHPVKSVQHPGSKIPARPFLMFQDEDIYGFLYPRLAVYLEQG
jgi:phage gpG-like protein